MALTIVQHPTDQESFYDCAYTRLPYLISGSTDTSQPQFRYVMDIFESGSSDLVHRTTQPVNPAGVAVFDPSRIFQGQLSYQNDWTVTGISESISSSRVYDVKFTTQYGTSDSSSITVQSYQASHSIGIISATTDLNLQSNPNLVGFAYDEYDTGWAFPGINFEQATSEAELFLDGVLSNNPYLMRGERDSLPHPNPAPALGDTNEPPLVKYDDYYTVSFLSNGSYPINAAGLNVTINSGSTSIATSSLNISNKRGVITYGVGPQNLINLDSSLGFMTGSNTWTSYLCEFTFRPYPGAPSGNSTLAFFANEDTVKNGLPIGDFPISQPVNICDDKTQFAFINNFGVYDYYTIYNPIRKISDLKRESVNLSQFNYSNEQPTITSVPNEALRQYEITRRGQKDFYIDRQDRFIVTTDYLLQPVAQWLEELMESPQVYVKESTGFIPINITNSRVQYNNNQARNKLFQYTIEFEYANKRLGNKTSPLGQS